MRVVVLACLVLAGCGFEPGHAPNDAPSSDASDAPGGTDDDAACESYSSLFDTCTGTMGSAPLTLTPGMWTYNTDTHELSDSAAMVTPVDYKTLTLAAGPLDVIFVDTLTIQAGATLRAIGPMQGRGFGIAAAGAVQIAGIIDVSSGGAGARERTACGAQAGGIGENDDGGAGGGGGGAFQGDGGGGSNGDSDMGTSQGAVGGVHVPRPASPIGGCPGGKGGNGNGTIGGLGGDAGGALYIASGTSITITGILDAGGHGGYEAGDNGDAGGGGGAGGMIVLEANTFTNSGVIVANGGGGGEGNTNGERGENGQRSTAKAKGGKGGDSNGGDGGDGGAAGTLAGETTADLRSGGGGGGGGSVGFIAIRGGTLAVSGTISPAYAAWP